MRITIVLAEDVAAAVEQVRRRRSTGLSEVVDDLLRKGLTVAPFRQAASDLGRPDMTLDDVAGLLDVLEGADRRS